VKVLILGGGQVAGAAHRTAPGNHQVTLLPRSKLDITDAEAVREAVEAFKPHWIVNAAAYTAVDMAEDEPAAATAANDTALVHLSHAADAAGSRLLHLSTDFVFDGAAGRPYASTDAPNPLSVYGSSKLAGERHVLGFAGGTVVRTSWVYASSGRNFVLTMLRLMREKPRLTVVSDQVGSPTWATGLAGAIWSFVDDAPPAGLYHWTDLGVASWYDFAVAIQEEALERGLLQQSIPIAPIASAQYPAKARRPAYSVLDTGATRAVLKASAQHWRHNLRMMLDELRTA
jgi:dTDP-4-dehydrorhamnose reductase